MSRKLITAVVALFLLFAMAWPMAWAAGGGSIELKSVAEVEEAVINDKGEKEVRLVDASKANVVPGDAVLFTTYYTNVDTVPAEEVVITNPVPEHMLYLDGSAAGVGSRIVFSVDGSKSYGRPDELVVMDSDGKKRRAKASEYTHIKWEVEGSVLQGKSGSVRFRAQLE